jgi:hypothetical protein
MENEVVVEPESVRAVAAAPIVEVRDLRGLGGFIVDDIEEGEGGGSMAGGEATEAPPRSRVAGRWWAGSDPSREQRRRPTKEEADMGKRRRRSLTEEVDRT